MNTGSFILAATMAVVAMAGSADAHQTLNADAIEEILEHPVMVGNEDLVLDPGQQTQQIVAMVDEVMSPLEHRVPGVVEKFVKILDCETHNHWDGKITHLDANGHIVRNAETGRAKGAAQLVPNPHDRTSSRMGLDLNQIDEQIVYARFLIEDRIRMGDHPLEDWIPCWS